MPSLSELGELHKKIGRLHLKLGRMYEELEIDPELLKSDKTEASIPEGVGAVWERLIDAWSMHRMDVTGKKPNRALAPSLTPERVKLVRDAIRRHGVDKTKRAAIGLFLSPFHTGKNDTGKPYLEPERPFQIKQGKDMTEYFAGIYMEEHREL